MPRLSLIDFPVDVKRFVADSPVNRPHIATFVAGAAAATPIGARVLDAGAGAAPYRELFDHTNYVTSDWSASMHAESMDCDIVAPLDALPVSDAAFDAVIATEVLEHVADPARVLSEVFRILAPGGRVWLTTPFVWELHEEPYDFGRYTGHALRRLLAQAGFVDVAVEPFGGWFSVTGQLVRNFGSITGRARPGAGLGTRILVQLFARGGTTLARLDRLDTQRRLPLGHTAVGTRPVVG